MGWPVLRLLRRTQMPKLKLSAHGGVVAHLYSDDAPALSSLGGQRKISRASMIEPNASGNWVVSFAPWIHPDAHLKAKGKEFPTRREALLFERHILTTFPEWFLPIFQNGEIKLPIT